MLEFHLKAKIKNLDSNSLQSIDANHTIRYNPAVNRPGVPTSIHLKRSANQYALHAFGKNGELKKDHEITLGFKHAFVSRTISVLLKTNDQGFIDLGELENIQYIGYSGHMGTYKQWQLCSDHRSLLPPAVCISANTDFQLRPTMRFSNSLCSLYKNNDR